MISATSNFITANAALQKEPIFIISVAGLTQQFTNKYTGVAHQVPWIDEDGIDDLTISVSDLDGGFDQGDLVFRIQDRGHFVTSHCSLPSCSKVRRSHSEDRIRRHVSERLRDDLHWQNYSS
jgi:hypothetical protein